MTIFKSFRFICTFRILLICINCFILFYLIFYSSFYVTATLFLSLIILQIISFITFIEKTNRKLIQFLEAVRYSDFTTSFSELGLGKSFDDLNKAFNEVFNAFRATRELKEEHFYYLQTVIQNVNVGLLVFDKNGKIDLINGTTKQLLKIQNLKNISELNEQFTVLKEIIKQEKNNDEHLIKIQVNNQLLQLSVKTTSFTIRGKELILLSLQNITYEMEEKEMESWQKLIRVLTHEIMNSLTPIITLASTSKQLLQTKKQTSLIIDDETYEDLNSAMSTIEKRSEGLLKFVEAYRHLTRIPQPQFSRFLLKELFDNINKLFNKKLEQNSIQFKVYLADTSLMLTADFSLIEQVIINLVTNAIEAFKETAHPIIKINAVRNETGNICIQIIDNGIGISEDVLDKIFIPFFTSKADGSGIGLSLSRQIMRFHKGQIYVQSKKGEGSIFTLEF
ncbi:MAG: hypothetical protein A3K10_17930 [Bacteroidetes bacterium RIFCSPLOWO2_12_FULL_31_6]|nr:MAG: hypothetical protein A3K10_17930 [Bacteroidetes bacterium RIFCSPLOWO2_12_FULL_31_6]